METLTPEEVEEATDGRYSVDRLIGQGGMGSVYLAVHRELGSKVAIKVLSPDDRLKADRLERFRREAQVSAMLSHPNLVPAIELRVKEDVAYLAMPYIEGATLEAHLRERGSPLRMSGKSFTAMSSRQTSCWSVPPAGGW